MNKYLVNACINILWKMVLILNLGTLRGFYIATGPGDNVQKLCEILVFRWLLNEKKNMPTFPIINPEKMFPFLWIFPGENWSYANEIFLDIFLFICHVNITYYKSPKEMSFLSCECFQKKIDHAWMKLSWTFSFFSIAIALLSRIFVLILKIVKICFTNTLGPILDIPHFCFK